MTCADKLNFPEEDGTPEECKSCKRYRNVSRICKLKGHTPFKETACYKCTWIAAMTILCKKCHRIGDQADRKLSP